MYKEYQSEIHPYPSAHPPGTRFWASGFRLSDPPAKIIRNMPATQVEYVCGGRTLDDEAALRKAGKYGEYFAPVTADIPLLRKKTTRSDLRFFTERKDAEDHYAECVARSIEAIDKQTGMLAELRARVTGLASDGTGE